MHAWDLLQPPEQLLLGALLSWSFLGSHARPLWPLFSCSLVLSQAPQKDIFIALGEHFQAVVECMSCIYGLAAALS